jgi:hypothetical protein
MAQPPNPSWIEHVDLIQVVIAALMAYMVFTLRELVNWFKASIADLYGKFNRLNEEFSELKGEHNARRNNYGRRDDDGVDGSC